MNVKKIISIILPIYNEEEVLTELVKRLESLITQLKKKFSIQRNSIEIIFVNDGSKDKSFFLLKEICEKKDNYKIINLSRNFGHQIAITAGMDLSQGESVVILDADLQDPPEFIVDLYQKLLEGYDVVYAVRKIRKGETLFRLTCIKLFYKALKFLAAIDIPGATGDFRIMRRLVVNAHLQMREKSRFIRGMICWCGFKQIGIEYCRNERYAGVTKYPYLKLFKLAWDGITSFSYVPLKFASYSGFLTTFLGVVYGLYALYSKIFANKIISGWTSLVLIILILGGMQLVILGIIGEYIGRISEDCKNRPLYIIEGIYEKRI